MAHLIENDEMMSVRITPWHEQGTVLDHAPTSQEAIVAAKLDWLVEKYQNQVKLPDGSIFMLDTYSTFRSENGKFIHLGNVKEDYTVVQNREAFKVLDKYLVDNGWTYETAGAILSGKKVWIMAKAPETMQGGGDDVQPYLLLSTSHDGSESVSISPTSVRVVCNNTLMLALQTSDVIRIVHKGETLERIDAVMSLINGNKFREVMDWFNAMQEYRVEPMQALQYWQTVVPELAKRNDPELKRNVWKTMFEGLRNSFFYGPGNVADSKTLWHAYNAMTEWVDHIRNVKPESRLAWTQFGAGAKMKRDALSAAVNLLKQKSSPTFVGVN